MVPVDARAVGLLNPRALKTAIPRAAGHAENGRLENDWLLEAETAAQPILVGYVVVDFFVRVVGVLVKGQQRVVVVGRSRRAKWQIRLRNQLQDLKRDWVDAGLRNGVAGKRRPADTRRGVARQWIVYLVRILAQVACAGQRGRNCHQIAVRLMIGGPQVVSEDEQLVLLDWPAGRPAKVVVGHVADAGVEETARVEGGVLQELVGGTVPVVGARLQNDVGHRAGGAAEDDVMVTGGNVHGLDSLDGRNDHLQQARALVVVNALDHVVVDLARATVHFRLQRAGSIEELRVLDGGISHPRNQIQQRLIIPVGAQRQRLDHDRVEVPAGIGAVRLQHRRRRGYLHGLSHIAGLQLDIDALAGIHR